jgi:hypothetical protein
VGDAAEEAPVNVKIVRYVISKRSCCNRVFRVSSFDTPAGKQSLLAKIFATRKTKIT